MKSPFSIFMILTCFCSFAQLDKKELKIITDSIQVEINDTSKNKYRLTDLNKILQALLKPDSLFPFSPFDSVIYKRYGTKHKFEHAHWNKTYMNYAISSEQLTTIQVDSILKIVNNPLQFQWGECGTSFIESSITFYNQQKKVATILTSCSHGQLFFEPDNTLSRWGVLNPNGLKAIDRVLKK